MNTSQRIMVSKWWNGLPLSAKTIHVTVCTYVCMFSELPPLWLSFVSFQLVLSFKLLALRFDCEIAFACFWHLKINDECNFETKWFLKKISDSVLATDYSLPPATVSLGKAFDPNYWARHAVAFPAAVRLWSCSALSLFV